MKFRPSEGGATRPLPLAKHPPFRGVALLGVPCGRGLALGLVTSLLTLEFVDHKSSVPTPVLTVDSNTTELGDAITVVGDAITVVGEASTVSTSERGEVGEVGKISCFLLKIVSSRGNDLLTFNFKDLNRDVATLESSLSKSEYDHLLVN